MAIFGAYPSGLLLAPMASISTPCAEGRPCDDVPLPLMINDVRSTASLTPALPRTIPLLMSAASHHAHLASLHS